MINKKKANKPEEMKDEDILRKQCKQIEDKINEVKEKKGRVGSIFKMKECILGPKKVTQEPTAVRHPESGDIVVGNEEIKRVTLEFWKMISQILK